VGGDLLVVSELGMGKGTREPKLIDGLGQFRSLW